MKKVTNDHRTRVTRLLIRKAFTDLLRQKPMQSISVKELCALAGINRGTFYTHYSDLYDLLEQMESDMMADFQKALEPMLSAKDRNVHPVEITTEIFQCLKDNADLCTVTLGEHGDKKFVMRLIHMSQEIYMEAYAHYFTHATPKQLSYFYAFVSAGCIGLLRKWLDDGMLEPANEIAQMAESLMLQGVGFLQKAPDPPEPGC